MKESVFQGFSAATLQKQALVVVVVGVVVGRGGHVPRMCPADPQTSWN